ncbi:MAG: hypothetical protein Q3999_07310 [Buchananella hordeovulneris]|nr:hypothetical protein [Buchananella hordeovulneris]
MSILSALQTLSALPEVRAAEEQVRQATTQLRWHEGLRRRWQEARAENAIRTACALAALAGARVPVAVLREEVARSAGIPGQAEALAPEESEAAGGRPSRPDYQLALAAWHACADVVNCFPPLSGRPGREENPPAPALLAGWHRSLTAPRGAHCRPGIPANPWRAELVADVLAGAGAGEGTNVLVRAAIVQAELAAGPTFAHAGHEMGVLAGWYVAVTGGLEPTGAASPAVGAVENPAEYRAALTAYLEGSTAGIAQWIRFVARAWETGAQVGKQICDSVLAGKTLP